MLSTFFISMFFLHFTYVMYMKYSTGDLIYLLTVLFSTFFPFAIPDNSPILTKIKAYLHTLVFCLLAALIIHSNSPFFLPYMPPYFYYVTFNFYANKFYF